MRHILTPLPLALLLATPAWGQVEQRLGSYTLPNGQVIPEGQNRSPAGHDAIAFRPNCDQVVPVSTDTGNTAWVLNMPDGVARVLATYPAGLDAFEARRYLANDGLCAWGGVEVPIIYTAHLPQQHQVQPDIAVDGLGDLHAPQGNTLLIGLGGLFLTGAAGLGFMLIRKGVKAPATPTTSPLSRFEDVLTRAMKEDEAE